MQTISIQKMHFKQFCIVITKNVINDSAYNRMCSYSIWEITQTLSILSDGTTTASVGGKRVDGRSRQANTFIIVIRSGQFGVTNGLYSVPAPGQKLELLDIYSGQSRSPPPPTVRLPNTPVLCPAKF